MFSEVECFTKDHNPFRQSDGDTPPQNKHIKLYKMETINNREVYKYSKTPACAILSTFVSSLKQTNWETKGARCPFNASKKQKQSASLKAENGPQVPWKPVTGNQSQNNCWETRENQGGSLSNATQLPEQQRATESLLPLP